MPAAGVRMPEQTSLRSAFQSWPLPASYDLKVAKVALHEHGDDIQRLADVLTDLMQGALAAGAGLVGDIHDRLDPGQMRRQVPAVGPPRPGPPGLLLPGARLGLGVVGRFQLLDVFEGQFQLIDRQDLRAPAEPVALQRRDDLPQPLGLSTPSRDIVTAPSQTDRSELRDQ